MKLFLFTWRTNYGEFFKIIRTYNQEDAETWFINTHNFTFDNCEELFNEGEQILVASGGGSNS